MQVMYRCSFFIGIWWKPSTKSKEHQTRYFPCFCTMSPIRGSGCPSFSVASFCGRRSWTSRNLPGSFFGTGNAGVFHGPWPSSNFPAACAWATNSANASYRRPPSRNGGTLTGFESGLSQISTSPNGPRFGGSGIYFPDSDVVPNSLISASRSFFARSDSTLATVSGPVLTARTARCSSWHRITLVAISSTTSSSASSSPNVTSGVALSRNTLT